MYSEYRECPPESPWPNYTRTKVQRQREAEERLVNGISIAGLLELYYAPNNVIRCMWMLTFLSFTGSVVYHSALLISFYLNQPITHQFIQTDAEIVPFPKVTVCAPTAINKTWAIDRLSFPSKEKELLEKMSEKERNEFIENVVALMGRNLQMIFDKSLTPRDRLYVAYHHVLTETYKNLPGGVESTRAGASPSCEQTVSNCQLNGISFNCCDTPKQLSDDGPCFDLQVDKFDVSTGPDRPSTKPASFSFDLTMDTNYETVYSTIDGFFIHLVDPFSLFGSPIAVPAGIHAMIDMAQPVKRGDMSNCLGQTPPATMFGPYDPKGHLCRTERYANDIVLKHLGCQFAYSSFVPNQTTWCTGSYTLPLKMAITHGVADKSQSTIRFEEKFSAEARDVFQSDCLPLCSYWQYTAIPGYSTLLRPDYSELDSAHDPQNISHSRVTIYLSSSFYIDRNEEQKQPFYITFQRITDVFTLYFGFSVITLVEIVFYLIHFCMVYVKIRKTNAIEPAQ